MRQKSAGIVRGQSIAVCATARRIEMTAPAALRLGSSYASLVAYRLAPTVTNLLAASAYAGLGTTGEPTGMPCEIA
jgi:hypothetical protein